MTTHGAWTDVETRLYWSRMINKLLALVSLSKYFFNPRVLLSLLHPSWTALWPLPNSKSALTKRTFFSSGTVQPSNGQFLNEYGPFKASLAKNRQVLKIKVITMTVQVPATKSRCAIEPSRAGGAGSSRCRHRRCFTWWSPAWLVGTSLSGVSGVLARLSEVLGQDRLRRQGSLANLGWRLQPLWRHKSQERGRRSEFFWAGGWEEQRRERDRLSQNC